MYFAKTWRRWALVLVKWIFVTLVGGGITYFSGLLVADFLSGTPLPFYWFAVPMGGAIGGAVTGVGQRRIMVSLLRVSSNWIWITALGWAVGLSILVAVSEWGREITENMNYIDAILTFVVGAAISGTAAGLGQWWMLDSRVPKAGWWLVGSSVGWIVAWVTAMALAWVLGGGSPLPTTLENIGRAVILGCVAGGLVGVEQGIALVGLFAQAEWEKERTKRKMQWF